jgi:hypothetical protein
MRLATKLVGLSISLVVGCWTGEPPPVSEPVHVYQPKPHRWSCDNLRSVSGNLPPTTDLSDCVWGDVDEYWSCASHKYDEEARALRSWAFTALGVCAP